MCKCNATVIKALRYAQGYSTKPSHVFGIGLQTAALADGGACRRRRLQTAALSFSVANAELLRWRILT